MSTFNLNNFFIISFITIYNITFAIICWPARATLTYYNFTKQINFNNIVTLSRNAEEKTSRLIRKTRTPDYLSALRNTREPRNLANDVTDLTNSTDSIALKSLTEFLRDV